MAAAIPSSGNTLARDLLKKEETRMADETTAPLGEIVMTEVEVVETALDILGACDLQLLSDITQDSEDAEIVPCWYVGWPQELEAGLWGGSVRMDGNFFRSPLTAYLWIVQHNAQLRMKYGEDRG